MVNFSGGMLTISLGLADIALLMQVSEKKTIRLLCYSPVFYFSKAFDFAGNLSSCDNTTK